MAWVGGRCGYDAGSMGDLVRITDVSARDGLQNEPGVIPAAQKARLVELLCATGVDEVEVTSFVSPRWVPQLGDAEEVLGLVKGWADRTQQERDGSTPSPSERGRGEGGIGFDPGLLRARIDNERNPDMRDRARSLRRDSSIPERVLWAGLRGGRLKGLKFRRQQPIDRYVVDFFCESARLVVELDGNSHDDRTVAAQDRVRDSRLRAMGLKVLRVSNSDLSRDATRVLEWILRTAIESTPHPCPLPLGEGGSPLPILSVLVPNEKGLERALEIHRSGMPLKVALFTAASETFSKRNTNATIAQTIERFRPLVPRALEEGMQVRVYISCAVACPFEGPIAPEAVRRVADMAVALAGEDSDLIEIDLGDTIGVAQPREIEALVQAMSEEQQDRLTLHLHDTFGRAAECVRAGLGVGVRSFDGSVAGLGGCPYASTPGKRAPGNISTELLVRTVREAGYETMVDPGALEAAAAWAREIVAAARSAPAGGGTA